MTVDNKSKKMTVKQDGKVDQDHPGQPRQAEDPVVERHHGRHREEAAHRLRHDRRAGPEGEGYRTKIDYAQRITWSGQFIHAAPWSEGVQGSANVSHGCVNVSMANGQVAVLAAR